MNLLLRLKVGRWKRRKERREWSREGKKEEREGRKKGRGREEADEGKVTIGYFCQGGEVIITDCFSVPKTGSQAIREAYNP